MTYEEYKNNKNNKVSKESNIIKVFINKTLTIIVFTLIISIISNNNETFRNFIINNVLNSTFDFSKINKLLSDFTDLFESDKTQKVSTNYENTEKYKDGIKYILSSLENVYVKNSGIVTYIGEKEGYNNTIVIQQSNGYYAWYGNIDANVKLYDYLEQGTILGTAEDEYYYVLLKDDKPINLNEN